MNKKNNAWLWGCLGLLVFLISIEIVAVFKLYVFVRLGLSRDTVMLTLWVIPIVITALVTKRTAYPPIEKILISFLFVGIVTFIGPLIHLLVSFTDIPVDLAGWVGLGVTMKIYFVISFATVGLGFSIGFILSKFKPLKKN